MESVSVDFSSIEGSKENIQPCKRGRKAEELVKHVKIQRLPQEQAAEKLEEKRVQFEDALASYEGDDPIIPWLNYLGWIQESFISGGQRSLLVPTLERCTKALQGLSRYKQDARFLRVWITYADNVASPEDIFKFMQANGLCSMLALWYKAYALVLTARGRLPAAEAVLLRGIEMRAEPAAVLRAEMQRFVALQGKRLAKLRAEAQAAEAALDPAEVRRALGESKTALQAGGPSVMYDENGRPVAAPPVAAAAACPGPGAASTSASTSAYAAQAARAFGAPTAPMPGGGHALGGSGAAAHRPLPASLVASVSAAEAASSVGAAPKLLARPQAAVFEIFEDGARGDADGEPVATGFGAIAARAAAPAAPSLSSSSAAAYDAAVAAASSSTSSAVPSLTAEVGWRVLPTVKAKDKENTPGITPYTQLTTAPASAAARTKPLTVEEMALAKRRADTAARPAAAASASSSSSAAAALLAAPIRRAGPAAGLSSAQGAPRMALAAAVAAPLATGFGAFPALAGRAAAGAAGTGGFGASSSKGGFVVFDESARPRPSGIAPARTT